MAKFWAPSSTYQYTLREERSAAAATDDKPVIITARVTISAKSQAAGGLLISWTTTGVEVSPDPEPIRRNIPQLGDSILFEPMLSIQMQADETGGHVEVVNVPEIGAAMKRGFHIDNPIGGQEAFLSKITSKDAIEGAVVKHQLAVVRAATLVAMPTTPAVSQIQMPGTSLRMGSETFEIIPEKRQDKLVHGRWSRVIEKDAANAATKQLLSQMGSNGSVPPPMQSDVIEKVDVYFDRSTGVLERAVHTQSAMVGSTAFSSSYELKRTH